MRLLPSPFVVGLIIVCAGCHSAAPDVGMVTPPVPPPHPIPQDIRRIAILYPQSVPLELRQAYQRLEGATFALKAHRPDLTIVDRVDFVTVLKEHRFQTMGSVADDSAISIGRVLGVDSILLYRIDSPSYRDRMWARRASDLPPVTVTSKLIRVESAEVLYHRVVVAQLQDATAAGSSVSEPSEYQRLSREALERGIRETVQELGRAFE